MGVPGRVLSQIKSRACSSSCLKFRYVTLQSLIKPKRCRSLLYHCDKCSKSGGAGKLQRTWILDVIPTSALDFLQSEKKLKPLLIEFSIPCSGVGDFWLIRGVSQRSKGSNVISSQEQPEHEARTLHFHFSFYFGFFLYLQQSRFCGENMNS